MSFRTGMKVWCFATLVLGMVNLFNLVFYFSALPLFETFDFFSKKQTDMTLLVVFVLILGSSVAVTQTDHGHAARWTLLGTVFISFTVALYLLTSSYLLRHQLYGLLNRGSGRDLDVDADTFFFLYRSFSERAKRYRCNGYPHVSIPTEKWCEAPEMLESQQAYAYQGDFFCHAKAPWRYNNGGRLTAGESNQKAKWFNDQCTHARWDPAQQEREECVLDKCAQLEDERNYCQTCATIFENVKKYSGAPNRRCNLEDADYKACVFYTDLLASMRREDPPSYSADVFVDGYGSVDRGNLEVQKKIRQRVQEWAHSARHILVRHADGDDALKILYNYIDIYGGEKNRKGVQFGQGDSEEMINRPFIWLKEKFGDALHKLSPWEVGALVNNEQYLMQAVWLSITNKTRDDWNFLLSTVKRGDSTSSSYKLMDDIRVPFADLVTDDPSSFLPHGLELDTRVVFGQRHIDFDRIGDEDLPRDERVQVRFRTPSGARAPGVTVLWSKEGDLLKRYPWIKRYWFHQFRAAVDATVGEGGHGGGGLDTAVDLQYAMLFSEDNDFIRLLPGAAVNGGYSAPACGPQDGASDHAQDVVACKDCGMRSPNGTILYCKLTWSKSRNWTLEVPSMVEVYMNVSEPRLPTSSFKYVTPKNASWDIHVGPSSPSFPSLHDKVFCQSVLTYTRAYYAYVSVWFIWSIILVVAHSVLIFCSFTFR